ncbi:MAG: hypothetical protein AAFP13_15420 [Pseudomonadota bacterium]
MPSKKTPVIEHLYNEHLNGNIPDGVVLSKHIIDAISATGSDLSKANPANFLKDIVRKETANDNWPDALTHARVTARQRYGHKKVFQFRPFAPGQTEPFPDRYLPGPTTPVHILQSASVPFAARQLGRKEESWLMQVVAMLRVIETQLAIFSPLCTRLRDVTHLQMSMKTQPEIDAVYLVSHGSTRNISKGVDRFSLVTCEAKQLGERILEDQIREQVAEAFKQTKKLAQPDINAVKPMAVQVRNVPASSGTIRGIYIVEFQRIARQVFEKHYAPDKSDPERLYRMPLRPVSQAVHALSPAVRGVNI